MSFFVPLRPVVTTLAVLLSLTSLHAQGKGQKIPIKTFDKVDLVGTFYPTMADGKRSPAVLLLHKLGGNSQDEGWETLAKTLQAKGMTVLSIDFRGHGESLVVDPAAFWGLTTNNRGIKGAGQPKISHKDFLPVYWPMLVNDIAAAKFFLEERNNSEECNINDLYIVAADDAATIAALWIAAEWSRKKPIYKYDAFTMRDVYVGEAQESPGKDIAAAIWLSPRATLPGNKAAAPLQGWLSVRNVIDTQPVFQKVPMCFFHGEEDKDGTKLAKTLHDAGINKTKKLANTYRVEMPKTNAAGSELLKGDVGTSDYVVQYIKDKVMKDRQMALWTKRETSSCPLHLVPQPTLARLGVNLP